MLAILTHSDSLVLTSQQYRNNLQEKTMNEKILAIIEKAEARGLNSFGIRAEGKIFEIGADLENSAQWGDTWDGEELEGSCALQIGYDGFEIEDIEYDLEGLAQYLGDDCKAILVGGTGSYEGTDAGETVIANAEVLYVI